MPNLQCFILHISFIIFVLTFIKPYTTHAGRKYTKEDILKLREEVREMFNHAYSGYLKYAYPYDELRPLTCDGVDTWGSYSLTLIDALDTLAVMGNYSEFRRVVEIVTSKANFDANINVSVFETNIRIVGGLLSAHLLSQRAGMELEPGWPCNGPLLRLAEDVAKRLIAAFDTATGMPYGTVNLRHGVPPGETSITCTAGVGTYIVEFGALSRLTGDPVYEEVAMNALHALYHHRSSIGLYGNHIDVMTGRWTAQDSGIGAGVDSYLEYLVKGALLVQRPELMAIFNEGQAAINKHLKRNDWYLWVSMHKGQITLPVFQSLEAYWPGVLSLIGDISGGMKSMHNYHQVWKQYGFTPEFYNIAQGQVGANRESYPLRPELIESTMYLYRATKDPFLLDVGMDILRSIQHSARTKCGYATIKDCRDHSLENRMESFFLAETTKYLFLLFDPDNFIHNDGQKGTVHTLPSGRECILDAGGYVFNTEAHPIDPGALLCCSENYNEPKRFNLERSRGEKLTSLFKKTHVNEGFGMHGEFKQSQSDDHGTNKDLPSAFSEEDKDTTSNKNERVSDRTEKSGALDLVRVPPPTSDEVQPVDDSLKSKPMSFNMLHMLEALININLEKHLFRTVWSRDLLVELIEVVQSAEKKLVNEKEVVETPNEISDDSGNLNTHSDKSDSKGETLNILTKNKSVSTSELKNESNGLEDNSLNTLAEPKAGNGVKGRVPSKEFLSKNSITENNFENSSLKVLDLDKTNNNLLDESKDLNVKTKQQSLFELVMTQQFKSIKETVLTETDLVMFHINTCNENLELTKNLYVLTNDKELKQTFFRERAEVVNLAIGLTISLKETKTLLNSKTFEESVTIDTLKRLTELVVDGKTVKLFLEKYRSFMETSKKLVELGKEKYKLDQVSIKSHLYDENVSNNENSSNGSEEGTNIYNNEEESKSIFETNNWKADDSSYQLDDKERVTSVSKIDAIPLFTDRLRMKTEAVIGLLPKTLLSSDSLFNPQMLLERIRYNPQYYKNTSWTTQYDLLTCIPQPYFTRIMVSGEFFND